MANIVEVCVHMDCSGCESKIKKALYKLRGVDEVEVDMVSQKVTVMGWADHKKVLKAVRKTGRRAVLWPYGNGVYQQPPVHDLAYCHYQSPAATMHYVHHPALQGSGHSSSYNYYEHGYDNFRYAGGNYPHHRDEATSMFSDDNTASCSIM